MAVRRCLDTQQAPAMQPEVQPTEGTNADREVPSGTRPPGQRPSHLDGATDTGPDRLLVTDSGGTATFAVTALPLLSE
jgi:hypothetical protein